MLIVTTENCDIYRNLAVEEWLLDHAPNLPVLFLYVNDPCVVIGKNQNPWRECRLSLMEKEGVPLARRISGGGAVYHDAGNLNVSIIVSRTEYREEKQYELIFQTLEKFGIKASKVRKNTLAVDGKKVSGQAFCFRGQRVLHHGTLLVNADLNRLGRYLGPEIEGIQTKAVASIPAEVMNLADAVTNPPRPSTFAKATADKSATPPVEGILCGKIPSFGGVPERRGGSPELTVETLSAALIETFKEMYAPGCGMRDAGCEECWNDGMIPEAELLPMSEKLSSRDWKLGHTPKFTFRGVEVEKGRVTNFDGNPLFEEWLKHER
jgi:lipoate-protein ligase A